MMDKPSLSREIANNDPRPRDNRLGVLSSRFRWFSRE